MRKCSKCGEDNLSEGKFCKNCDPQLSKASVGENSGVKSNTGKDLVGETSKILFSNSFSAAGLPGDMVLSHASFLGNAIGEEGDVAAPLTLIFTQIKKFFLNIKEIFKNKIRLIFVLILATLWILLMLLPIFGFNPGWVRKLSFLTFAQGGMTGGILGASGGVIGKSMIAYFFIAFIPSFFTQKGFAKNFFSGFSKNFSPFRSKNFLVALPLFLLGLGFSLVCYSFLTGNGSTINSTVGIVAFILSLKALSNNSGFLRQLVRSLRRKSKKGNSEISANNLISGWAIGFALGVGLSFIPLLYIGYYLGATIIIIGLLLFFLLPKKGGTKT